MSLESWFPIGYEFPDKTSVRRVLHEGTDWQILETRGGGRALVAHERLAKKWMNSGLLDEGSLVTFAFGDQELSEISSGPSHILAPLVECKSPDDKSEALSFAMAMKATREIDSDSPLQDAIYVEKLSRLLPTYSITSRTDDDIVLGYWLTGGARVSAKSFRRLRQMLSWMGSNHLYDVVAASGIGIDIEGGQSADKTEPRTFETTEALGERSTQKGEKILSRQGGAEPFLLPGRPDLEAFFNEHVIDIVQNPERYKAFGIGFPSAVVLHGPPGCGKTFAVEKLVEHLGWPMFQIDASSVASPYIHETSRKVAEVFEKAMQSAPSVLVIDEMEAFLADRDSGGGGSNHRVEEVAEFLRRIPEATKNEVLVIAMTNKIEMIDQAIMRRGRFDHVIKVDFASEKEVLDLLIKLLETLPKDDSVEPVALAKRLAGRPLSDVTFVVREGARLCARTGKDRLEQELLIQALDGTPSRSDEGQSNRIGFV
jgi:hypothetical protein